MRFDLNLDNFQINLLIPAAQTSLTLVATHLLGRLGYYDISIQTTAIISATAFIVSAIAHKLFKKGSQYAPFYYGSIPFGIGVGMALHRFLYPYIPLGAILGIQSGFFLNSISSSIEFVNDSIYHFRYDNSDKKVLVALHHL